MSTSLSNQNGFWTYKTDQWEEIKENKQCIHNRLSATFCCISHQYWGMSRKVSMLIPENTAISANFTLLPLSSAIPRRHMEAINL